MVASILLFYTIVTQTINPVIGNSTVNISSQVSSRVSSRVQLHPSITFPKVSKNSKLTPIQSSSSYDVIISCQLVTKSKQNYSSVFQASQSKKQYGVNRTPVTDNNTPAPDNLTTTTDDRTPTTQLPTQQTSTTSTTTAAEIPFSGKVELSFERFLNNISAETYYQVCQNNEINCENGGICYVSLTLPATTFCRCNGNFFGLRCEKEENEECQRILFGLALLSGVTLILAFAVSCRLYVQSGHIKQAKKYCRSIELDQPYRKSRANLRPSPQTSDNSQLSVSRNSINRHISLRHPSAINAGYDGFFDPMEYSLDDYMSDDGVIHDVSVFSSNIQHDRFVQAEIKDLKEIDCRAGETREPPLTEIVMDEPPLTEIVMNALDKKSNSGDDDPEESNADDTDEGDIPSIVSGNGEAPIALPDVDSVEKESSRPCRYEEKVDSHSRESVNQVKFHFRDNKHRLKSSSCFGSEVTPEISEYINQPIELSFHNTRDVRNSMGSRNSVSSYGSSMRRSDYARGNPYEPQPPLHYLDIPVPYTVNNNQRRRPSTNLKYNNTRRFSHAVPTNARPRNSHRVAYMPINEEPEHYRRRSEIIYGTVPRRQGSFEVSYGKRKGIWARSLDDLDKW